MSILLLFSLLVVSSNAVTFILPSRAQECFEFHATKDVPITIPWEVLRGGDLDVVIRITSPEGVDIALKDVSKYGLEQFKSPASGFYKLCFLNTKSRFTEKVIKFDLMVNALEEPLDPVNQIMYAATDNIISTLDEVVTFQTRYHTKEDRQKRSISSTKSRLFWFSVVICIVIVATSVAQVFFVKTWFSSPSSSKPGW